MVSGSGEGDEAIVIAVEGKLVLGAPVIALRERMAKTLETAVRAIDIDLSRVSYVDSAGIGALALAFFNAKNSGRILRIAGPQPNVMAAIGLTKLDSVIPIVASAGAL
jgi:anti-anti-sigma factor